MQQTPAFFHHHAARMREPRAAAAAVEQFDVEIAFELLDDLGERRRHAVQPFRCFAERAGPVDRIQCFEGFE
jgi:hypothetical protein